MFRRVAWCAETTICSDCLFAGGGWLGRGMGERGGSQAGVRSIPPQLRTVPPKSRYSSRRTYV
eukprot:15977747-Heterocapsa_arctica.AAC.1